MIIMNWEKIHYKIEGTGKTVVLLHGFLEDLTMWDAFALKLARHYKVLRIDLLGHGKTTINVQNLTMEKQAEAVKTVLEKEAVSRAVFVGHSMGGYVLLALLDQYPELVQGFSLFFSSAAADNEKKKECRMRAIELVKKQRKVYLKSSISNLFRPSENKALKEIIKHTIQTAGNVSSEHIISSLQAMRDRKDRSKLLQNTFPKQLLAGKYDMALDKESLEKQIQIAQNLDCQLFNTGHMGHYEAPEETYLAVENFINNCYG